MKITVTESMFKDHFKACGRGDQFSYAALGSLFEYYDEMESDMGEEMELDPVAICCDWSEYATASEAAREMSDWEPDPDAEDGDNETAALEHLRDNTTVIETGESYLVLSF